MTDAERWRRIDELFDRALDMSPGHRGAFLEDACADDPALRAAVERLLGAHEQAHDFLDQPAAVLAAPLLDGAGAESLAPGTRIGAYTIIDALGYGGMGVVYRAHDERLDRTVALKFLPPYLGGSEAPRRELLAEARLASALDHPGIAVIHEIGETPDGQLFIAMACYDGETLAARIARGPLPASDALPLALQIADALAAAHRKGIVHRDIKPRNIIITPDGLIRILDFGIARIAGAKSGDAARGTLAYISPEHRRGEAVDARTDVWSLGIVLLEMLTGEPPSDRLRTTDGTPTPPIPRAVPAPLRTLIARCLAVDPAARYDDAGAVAAALRQVAHAFGAGSDARSRRRTRVAAAAAASTLALVSVAVLLQRQAASSNLSILAVAPDSSAAAMGAAHAMTDVPRIADVTTTSLVAYRFYEEGLRSLAAGDARQAERLFEAALDEDSLFAMAAHYLWNSRGALHQMIPSDDRARLLRLAERAGGHERLLMRAAWDPQLTASQRVALADTLVARYPGMPDGHLMLGVHLISAGDFARARRHLERAAALDSLAPFGDIACRSCDALGAIMSTHIATDSIDAAVRVGREWVRRQPQSSRAWWNLAIALLTAGRNDEALDARRTAATLNPADRDHAIFPAMARIRSGDFDGADRLLRELASEGSPELRAEALWYLCISLRHQGRLEEALAVIRATRTADYASSLGLLPHQAQVLFEMRRFADAARLFAAAAAPDTGLIAWQARRRAWNLTHLASTRAAAGDTAGLAALADTIRVWGAHSYYGRDWRLHHHVHGLLLVGRGRHVDAASAFRRALYSPTIGYTRTSYELARTLLELKRADEAIGVLQSALRGPLEASNLYVTRTDLHALLGHAWETAGRSDSAAAHYTRVLHAWQRADPVLHARRDTIRGRLNVLGGAISSRVPPSR